MYDFYSFYIFAKKDDKFFQNIEDSTSDIFRSIKISAPKQLSIYHKENSTYYIYTKQNKKGYVGFATKFKGYIYKDFATALKVYNRIIDYINYKSISDAQRYSDLRDFVKKSFHKSKFGPCEEKKERKKERKGKQAKFNSSGLDTNKYFKVKPIIESINNNDWTYITILETSITNKIYTSKQVEKHNTSTALFTILFILCLIISIVGFVDQNFYDDEITIRTYLYLIVALVGLISGIILKTRSSDLYYDTTEDEWKPSPTEWLGGYLLADKMFDKMFKNKK